MDLYPIELFVFKNIYNQLFAGNTGWSNVAVAIESVEETITMILGKNKILLWRIVYDKFIV